MSASPMQSEERPNKFVKHQLQNLKVKNDRPSQITGGYLKTLQNTYNGKFRNRSISNSLSSDQRCNSRNQFSISVASNDSVGYKSSVGHYEYEKHRRMKLAQQNIDDAALLNANQSVQLLLNVNKRDIKRPLMFFKQQEFR